MTLWLIFALMTAAAIFAVLWPLSRRDPGSAGSDVAVYRDQLDEIDRDRAAGRIGEGEAAAARVEVSRRLIAAADAETAATAAPPVWRRRAVAIVALLLLPFGAGAIYLALGSPDMPDRPLAARTVLPPDQAQIMELVARVETHLEANPEDGRGWEVLAPVYMRMNRYADAVKARRNALRLLGSTSDREAGLGEALVGVANGIVTAEAKAAFERALLLDPKDVGARYFLGLAAEQDGRPVEAAAMWTALLADAPPDAPWAEPVRQSLARVDPKGAAAAAPSASRGPSADDIAAAGELSPEQRTTMVRGMVDRLAERLKQDGSDVEGWLRLVRAYMVMGEPDKARAAAGDARRALAAEPDKLKRVEDLVKGLGLEG